MAQIWFCLATYAKDPRRRDVPVIQLVHTRPLSRQAVAHANHLDVWIPVGFPRRLLVLPCQYHVHRHARVPLKPSVRGYMNADESQDLLEAYPRTYPHTMSPHGATCPPLTTCPPVGDMSQGLVALTVVDR